MIREYIRHQEAEDQCIDQLALLMCESCHLLFLSAPAGASNATFDCPSGL